MPEYQKARAISVFLSMPGKEISTREIVLDAFDKGKGVFIPYIYAIGEGKNKDRVMDMLQLRDQSDFESLVPDSWGIPSLDNDSVNWRGNALGGVGLQRDAEPPSNAAPELDLVFVPAVAFDQAHRRLGHGKGFYDRYLQKYHSDSSRSGQPMPKLGRPLHLMSSAQADQVSKVGLALRPQILPAEEEVPVDENDWLVDIVITPEE